MSDWQPRQYLEFADERTRPARDLLAQVPLDDARTVYDLGCGPGNSTALLMERFPGAWVIGVDNSPAMLAAGRKACPQAEFREADLATWQPDRPADLLFSNATFHWVPDHLAVLQRLAAHLRPGGVLAVQMPDNMLEPCHTLMQDVANDGPWAATLAGAAEEREVLPPPTAYYEGLKPLLQQLDVWQTVYQHPLDGARGIVEWFSTTGLRPYLNRLAAEERQDFLVAYEARITKSYPALADGKVLLRFPRLFFVGVR